MLKQIGVLFAASLLCAPALPGVPPLGFVDSTTNATLSGVQAEAGSSVFDGDGVRVRSGGNLGVLLAGGSRAAFAPNTNASLARSGGRVVVKLEVGAALLAASPKSPVEGSIANATFRPAAAGRQAIGWMGLKQGGHVVFYADKGDWVINTGTDGRTVLLRQGDRMEGSVLSATQGSNTQPRGKKRRKKLAAFWISAGMAGLGVGLGLGLEPSSPVNCVDPIGQTGCVPVSPVVP